MLRPRETLTIDYGQASADGELAAARSVAQEIGLAHETLRVDARAVGAGLLAGSDEALSIAPTAEWWPFRNQLLITLGGAVAIKRGHDRVMLGSVKGDGRHADGRPGFFHAIDHLTHQQEGALRVVAPAIDMTSEDLLRESELPFRVAAWTHSCHVADFACGYCPGCTKRLELFHRMGWYVARA